MSALLEGLNDRQIEAVTHEGGPLLVLAGAGSGKTRVITRRIAWLVLERGEAASSIIAVTFTNKAAAEMRGRVNAILEAAGREPLRAQRGWVGTFHALCLRILRIDGERIGLPPSFVVLDADDQLALVRRLVREAGADDAQQSARAVQAWISRHKNNLRKPEDVEAQAVSPEARLRARIYAEYEAALRKQGAVDFDDLLVRTLELFDACPDVADRRSGSCRHLLVDEYQDTNRPQYLLVRALARVHGNVFVVGDEDQSIYRFRGAEIRNILDFERDHPGTRTIKLEENYRSTGTILDAAGAVVANNQARKGKVLWTRNDRGDRLTLFRAPDDRAEAIWVSERLRALAPEIPYERTAILYRTNAQSRQFEEIFRRDRIPHQVVGAVGFYERKEVKDLLAYLRLAVHPADDVSFRRIVNTPPRGIGDTTVAAVEDAARENELSLMDATRRIVERGILPSRPWRLLREFLQLHEELARRAAEERIPVLLDWLIRTLSYDAYLEKTYPGQGADRMDNVRALVSAAVEYEEEAALDEEGPTLAEFLDRSALVSDADQLGAGRGVTLMTVHIAKGLEFDAVFLPGLEENLFPHARATQSAEDLEEERRLLYVAMTRARKRLLLSHASYRRLRGELLPNPPSRFLDEIPEQLVQEVRGSAELSWGIPSGRDVFPRSITPPRTRRGDWSVDEPRGSSAARVAVRALPPEPIVAGAEPPRDDAFRPGATVKHPMFGRGRILDREGSGKNLKLTIDFDQHGPKKILPAYTRLLVAGGGSATF